jgi:hypothetical protein
MNACKLMLIARSMPIRKRKPGVETPLLTVSRPELQIDGSDREFRVVGPFDHQQSQKGPIGATNTPPMDSWTTRIVPQPHWIERNTLFHTDYKLNVSVNTPSSIDFAQLNLQFPVTLRQATGNVLKELGSKPRVQLGETDRRMAERGQP